jgi:molybdopterin adenylyltransferase
MKGPNSIEVAVLTVSDSAIYGTRQDVSGPAIRRRCEEIGWTVVTAATVPDEVNDIARHLREWADSGAATLVLTTGGTGVAPRDVTPEATRSVLDREIPGLAELMRARGLEQTRNSALSRAVAGSRKNTLIVNLPGSPKGALFSLETIADLVPHVVDLLAGITGHGSDAKLSTTTETLDLSETSYEHEKPAENKPR